MRYLGIDYGTKRVGIAVSSEDGKIAFPHGVWPCDGQLGEQIKKFCKEREIGAIVIGDSKDFNGKDNPIMDAVRALADDLENGTGLPVFLEPEFLTSAEASRAPGGSEKLDVASATIILQSYLDKENNKK